MAPHDCQGRPYRTRTRNQGLLHCTDATPAILLFTGEGGTLLYLVALTTHTGDLGTGAGLPGQLFPGSPKAPQQAERLKHWARRRTAESGELATGRMLFISLDTAAALGRWRLSWETLPSHGLTRQSLGHLTLP